MKQKSLILMSTLLVCSLESFAQNDVEKNDSIWKDFDLASVTVVASKPLVKMETDKMTYNVQQDAEAKASTVLDMLRKVPMVTVDGQDNITVNGSSSFKVYVDGKPNPMFSANPSQIFKAMPASNSSRRNPTSRMISRKKSKVFRRVVLMKINKIRNYRKR